MSVLLTSAVYIDSVLTAAGTTVSLGYDREEELVSEGAGTWVVTPTTPTPPAASFYPSLLFIQKRLTVEIANIYNVGTRPSGADWLFSAARDLNTFTRYLQFEPTVFFDPSDSTSLNYGTEEEPYNARADVNRYMAGNKAGCVLGIKRGTHLYNTSSTTAPLNFTCYGSQTNPVLVVPYGDPTLPMPIIDGSYVTGSGSYVWSASVGNIWRVAVAFDTDVFENGTRCNKKTWNTDAATTLTAAGMATYNGGYLYYWPRSTSNPNDGTLKINYNDHAVALTYPDLAAAGQTGNVKFIGLDIRHSRYDTFWAKPATLTNATSIGAVDVLFCRVGRAGYDANLAGGTSTDGIIIYGAHATLRIGTTETISSRVIGNEIYDCSHNPVEFAFQDNSLTEFNYIHDSWGNAHELWVDCSGNVLRNNRIENMTSVGRIYNLQGGFIGWYNNTQATQAGSPAFDNAHTQNISNQAYNNYCKNASQQLVICTGGGGSTATTPHKIYNNTFDIDHDAIYPSGGSSSLPAGLNTLMTVQAPTGTTGAATGFLIWSNNLLYYHYSPILKASPGYGNSVFVTMATPGAAANIPSGDHNCYFQQTGSNVAGWIYGGSSIANFTTYKSAMAAYNLDQNSICAYGTNHPIATGAYGNSNGGTETVEEILFSEVTGKPGTGSHLIAAGTNASSNRLTDYIGQTVLAVATPAIGCYER